MGDTMEPIQARIKFSRQLLVQTSNTKYMKPVHQFESLKVHIYNHPHTTHFLRFEQRKCK